jgi:excisionase family DNA binding protein
MNTGVALPAKNGGDSDDVLTRDTLSVQECATFYGVNERFIRELIASRQLRAYRLGSRMIRIKRSDLVALLTPID